MYLAAIIDWFSRYVIAWRLSNTLDGDFCLEMLDEALGRGKPEVFNTDQGVQFTAQAWTSRLQAAGVAVSMDGKGRCLDNVFVERLWRTVKYEDIYLKGYEAVPLLHAGLEEYFPFYSNERPHQALQYRTPAAGVSLRQMRGVRQLWQNAKRCDWKDRWRFSRHGSGVRKGTSSPSGGVAARGDLGWPFGAPSAGLSLGRLLASRACLCFTRRQRCTATGFGEQEQPAHDSKGRGHDDRTRCSEGSLVFLSKQGGPSWRGSHGGDQGL